MTYSLKILFDRRKRLLLRLQRKSENIKNLIENKFNVRAASEELKRYDDLLKLFLGVQGEIMGSLMMNSRKLMIFGLMKLIKKSSPFSILCIIICEKMKRSSQEDLEVLEKLNHQAQVQVLNLECLENQLRSKLIMKK